MGHLKSIISLETQVYCISCGKLQLSVSTNVKISEAHSTLNVYASLCTLRTIFFKTKDLVMVSRF